ncbi:DEAD/DEAH box helicase [Rhodopseudomonas boonkerdii]|uniref:DEAD/DEAH box helicase n=1 Tax=Rhodopseudomonas boonkerdii TaxID=475937 RepID=UPI001E38CB11|nr:DEAD/DEAH box helicase [Rhodopseudomonas boonkerdii]UGV27731.1 DEAD/DEAH box helicase [Rhodopseudomonas boonkerdii]
MIQDLADTIWADSRFHRLAKAIERNWLSQELKIASKSSVSEDSAARAMSASAILACSETLEHRIGALRLSTYVYETFGRSKLPFDSALRVVLSRLKNFPALETRDPIAKALPTLPLSLALEEISEANAHTILLGKQKRLLTGFQRNLWTNLNSGRSIALSAPTSVGKSFVLELYLTSLFENEIRTVVYLVPSRALIAQVSRELTNLFKDTAHPPPRIITVPPRSAEESENVIYVMTQERLHITLHALKKLHVDLLVIDEAHSISEGARGILLQTVIDDVVRQNQKAQLLFASPTTRNLDAFGRIFSRPDITPQSTKEPTVSQNFVIVERSGKNQISLRLIRETGRSTTLGEREIKLPLRNRHEKLANISYSLCNGQANLIYANGADEAEDIALTLTKRTRAQEPTPRRIELARIARETVHPEYILAECALKGIGFHYANIPTNLRQAIEAAFADGELKYLVCTSTLLQGINLPAKNIFMFKPTRGQNAPLKSPDFWNLAGRAGRLRREFQGNIFLVDYEDWVQKPIGASKEIDILSAIETSIKLSASSLNEIIRGTPTRTRKAKKIELESASIRLFADYKYGRINETLSRLNLTQSEKSEILNSVREAETRITIPIDILKRNHNISAHKQQKLLARIREDLAKGEILAPLPPSDSQSYRSYAAILEMCHSIVLDIDTSKGLHRFHAVLARKWMLGYSLPRIINEGLRKQKEQGRNPDKRSYIRNMLDVIEDAIRFQTIRLFGCYRTLLEHALSESAIAPRPNIPDVELFLELGASTETMVSLMSLGLSRAVAIKLNGARAKEDPDLNVQDALAWLHSIASQLHSLKLSDIQIDEVRMLLRTDGN